MSDIENNKQFSALRKFVGRTHQWLAPESSMDLSTAQRQVVDFLNSEDDFEISRDKMIETVNQTESLEKLVKYLYNSLLEWEGDGVD